MGVNELKTMDDYHRAVEESKNGFVVFDFYATWCGPCRLVAPQIDKMSVEFKDVKFYKLDVDELPQAAQINEVRAMPTFLIFRHEKKVKEIVGANPKGLKSAISDLVESETAGNNA